MSESYSMDIVSDIINRFKEMNRKPGSNILVKDVQYRLRHAQTKLHARISTQALGPYNDASISKFRKEVSKASLQYQEVLYDVQKELIDEGVKINVIDAIIHSYARDIFNFELMGLKENPHREEYLDIIDYCKSVLR